MSKIGIELKNQLEENINTHQDILKISKIDFTYHKFSYDHDYVTYQKKILNSLKMIKTNKSILVTLNILFLLLSISSILFFK